MTNPVNGIKFNCPQCGQHLAVYAAGAGMTLACQKYGRAIIVRFPSVLDNLVFETMNNSTRTKL
jgi:DNA-directed RNA polymerase subunit M/transcription elongation factor TFIIS